MPETNNNKNKLCLYHRKISNKNLPSTYCALTPIKATLNVSNTHK